MMQRIKNIISVVKLLPKLLSKRDKVPAKPEKILIIQSAKLGDMVCTTPMFRAIKNKFPNCGVYVMGNSINREVLKYNDDVDGYIELNNPEEIYNHQFDFASITAPNFQALSMLLSTDIGCIVAPKIVNGFSPIQTRLYKFLLTFVILKEHKMGSYAPREYLKLLEPLDINENNTEKHLAFSKEAGEKAERFFKNRDGLFIGITPSAGNKIKQWPVERFAEISNWLIKQYKANIIVFGATGDREMSEQMISMVEQESRDFVTDLTANLSIDELKAYISKLNLFISVDTGPIYIAEAFNIPTVDITGPIDENEQPPIGKLHKVVTPKDRKKPELFVMNAKQYDYQEALRQVTSISTENVKESIGELLDLLNEK